MSFTGLRTDPVGATLHEGGPASAVVARTATPEAGARAGRTRPVQRDPRGGARDGAESRTLDAVDAASSWLLDHQHADGHWRAPLEGDTILESEYILILAWAGKLGRPEVPGAAQRILQEQLPGGGWAIHPGGPVDVSASVKAYLALKITGHDPNAEPLRRAATAIRAAGGPWAVNSFTRFYLALLGQISYAECPAVPPEMVLLPDWFPVNLRRVSAWSRTMIVPLSLIWAFKPVLQLEPDRGIAELFEADEVGGRRVAGGTGGWDRFFRGVDRLVKGCDAVGIRPLRRRAVAACRRWMLERFDGSDGLGAIFPPIVWSIVALRAMGCADESPEVEECWRQLWRLVEPQADGSTRLEPCRSPVWDTAISVRALADASAARGVSPTRAAASAPTLRASACPEAVLDPKLDAKLDVALESAVDWLLDREIRQGGDWTRSTSAVEPSGWCFQYANRFYPDIDDTAMVLIAFATWRASAAEAGDGPRLRRVSAAVRRAVAWLESMQSSDGGWGAFDRDNNMEILCKVPFADHNAMIDPSSPDLAGRVLEAFGKLGLRVGHPAVDRGIAYLRASQEPEGCWFGRWGVNYVYGTWQAIEGLRSVGVAADDPVVVRGADWLARHQQPCGGWGETPESYADPGLAGCGTPTASQTAWAVAGLIAAGRHDSREACRGVQWLAARQRADGGWDEREFTGTGFPKVFYLRYHYYPIYFPLMTLARFAQATGVQRHLAERVA